MSKQPKDDDLPTMFIEEVAKLVGNVHPSTLWRRIARGQFPRGTKLFGMPGERGTVRWSRNEVLQYLRNQRAAAQRAGADHRSRARK